MLRAVIILMVGVLVVIKPDALKGKFGEKKYAIDLNPEAAPTKSYIRLMRGIGIFAIAAGILGILKELNII